MANSNIYTPGGTVQAGRGLYISRQADEELLQLCQEGKYAYVLTSRQMGKSSLMIETARRLQQRGTTSIIIDLSDIGVTDATAENWYRGVALEIENKLDEEGQPLTTDVYEWWEAHSPLTITQRFTRFFRDVLLEEIKGRVVVFIDEIDTTLNLGFTDDFFIAIRALYTTRAQFPSYERLSFVLIGVATPGNLILDARRTPFNIGHRVDLTDFTAAEAWPLAAGLGVPEADQAQVFNQVLAWTGGHPYLTQQLCIELSRQQRDRWNADNVDEVVHQTFFGDRSDRDHNLQFVRDLLIDPEKCPDRYQVLATYRDIWRDRQPVIDEDQSLIKAHLKLSGVVKRVGSRLEVRNPIYREVFDGRWIKKHWPETWWERIKPAMPLIAGLSAVAVFTGGSLVYAIIQGNEALQQAERAKDALAEAETAREDAETARDNALAAQQEADRERKRAEAEEAEAERRRLEAEAANQLAEEQRQQAVLAQQAEAEQRQRAEQGERAAVLQAEAARQAQRQADENAEEANMQRRIAQDQALSSDIETRSLTIENLLSLQRNTFGFWSAIGLGRRIQALDSRAMGQPIALSKELFSRGDVPLGTVSASSRLQAVSVLEKIYHFDGYLERQTLRGHESAVLSVSFSPDGETIASASWDGTIILWDLNLESLLDKSCEWWRDYLTSGNASDEEKALCPHIIAPQPLHSTRFGPSQWLAHLQATWHATLGRL